MPKLSVDLLIQVGTKAVPIVRDVAPYINELVDFFQARGIEADRAKLQQIVMEAAEGKAISDAEVARGSDAPEVPEVG